MVMSLNLSSLPYSSKGSMISGFLLPEVFYMWNAMKTEEVFKDYEVDPYGPRLMFTGNNIFQTFLKVLEQVHRFKIKER